jgi:hypothetical protein
MLKLLVEHEMVLLPEHPRNFLLILFVMLVIPENLLLVLKLLHILAVNLLLLVTLLLVNIIQLLNLLLLLKNLLLLVLKNLLLLNLLFREWWPHSTPTLQNWMMAQMFSFENTMLMSTSIARRGYK